MNERMNVLLKWKGKAPSRRSLYHLMVDTGTPAGVWRVGNGEHTCAGKAGGEPVYSLNSNPVLPYHFWCTLSWEATFRGYR